VTNCRLCGHTKKAHAGLNGECHFPLKIEAIVDGHLARRGAERWVLCTCPVMVFSVYQKCFVKMSPSLYARLEKFCAANGVGKADTIRVAIDEFLRKHE